MIEFLNAEFVMTFLMGLNESYAQIRAQILLIDPLPPINKVFSLIIQEERQRSIETTAPIETITLMANAKKRFTPDRSKKKDNRPVCTNCGYKGHIVDKCYKLHDYPPGHRLANTNLVHQQRPNNPVQTGNEKPSEGPKSNHSAFFASLNNDQYSQLLNMLQTHMNTPEIDEASKTKTSYIASTRLSNLVINSCWIIDSGESSHICHDKFMFKELHSTQNMSAILPTKTRLKVEYPGDISIARQLVLNDVLYIPDFKYNLLSVSALLKDGKYSISFTNTNCIIQDKSVS